MYCSRVCSVHRLVSVVTLVHKKSGSLSQVGTRFFCDGSSESDSSAAQNKLDLSQPPKKFHAPKHRKISKAEAKTLKKSKDELGPQMVKAVRAVAAEVEHAVGLGINEEAAKVSYRKVQDDLLSKLKQAGKETKRRQELGDIFAGMEIEKQETESDSYAQQQYQQTLASEQRWPASQSQFPQPPSTVTEMFDAEPANLFKCISSEDQKQHDPSRSNTPLWDALERAEVEQLLAQPPRNGWEEMILWTNQGKLFHFPIDNEQGMDAEGEQPFDAHVMLEPLLDEGFPKRGPIRHFMEIVVTGLAKNYHLTVAEKRQHIDWFRDYFKQHKELLDNVIEEQAEPPPDAASKRVESPPSPPPQQSS